MQLARLIPAAKSERMEFPVNIAFKALSWGPQFCISDATGNCIGFVSRPLLSLATELSIYADESMQTRIYSLRTQNALDFVYDFADAAGSKLGRIAYASAERAFLVSVGEEPRFAFIDETPWVQGLDALIPVIPVFNAFTGLFVRPKYLASRRDGGGEVLRVVKIRGMFEARYWLYKLGELDSRERECVMLAALIMILRERVISG